MNLPATISRLISLSEKGTVVKQNPRSVLAANFSSGAYNVGCCRRDRPRPSRYHSERHRAHPAHPFFPSRPLQIIKRWDACCYGGEGRL